MIKSHVTHSKFPIMNLFLISLVALDHAAVHLLLPFASQQLAVILTGLRASGMLRGHLRWLLDDVVAALMNLPRLQATTVWIWFAFCVALYGYNVQRTVKQFARALNIYC